MHKFTEFDPTTGTATDNPSDTLLERLECVWYDPMDPLLRHYLEAATARIRHLESQ